MGLASLSEQMQKSKRGRGTRGTTGAKGHNEGGEEVRGEPDPAWREQHGRLSAHHKAKAQFHLDLARTHERMSQHHTKQAEYHDSEAQQYVGEKGKND